MFRNIVSGNQFLQTENINLLQNNTKSKKSVLVFAKRLDLNKIPLDLETDYNSSTFHQGRTEQISSYSTVVWKDCEEIGLVMKRK